jgi:hypothetical protein
MITQSYSTKKLYLKNHTLHNFHNSAQTEKDFIEQGKHLPVIHQLNIELQEKFGISIDYDSLKEYYDESISSKSKNKSGIDISFNLIKQLIRQIVKENFSIDMKIRATSYDDFLAETVSVDRGPYSKKIPIPGWAVDHTKQNDAILYIIPNLNKASLIMRKELLEGFNKSRFPYRNEKIANNGSYVTRSIPISWERLKKVCPSTLLFNYE